MNQEEVLKIAHLARIELSKEELARFAGQLTSILGYFQKLQELDTTGVPPATHPQEIGGRIRADVPECTNPPQQLLALSKGSEDGFFVVPRILDHAG